MFFASQEKDYESAVTEIEEKSEEYKEIISKYQPSWNIWNMMNIPDSNLKNYPACIPNWTTDQLRCIKWK